MTQEIALQGASALLNTRINGYPLSTGMGRWDGLHLLASVADGCHSAADYARIPGTLDDSRN